MRAPVTLMLAAAALALLFAGAAAAGTVLHMKADAGVDGGNVRLAEIAVIESTEDGMIERLSDIKVGTAPQPGLTRLLDIDYVKVAVRQQGINPDALTFEPDQDVMLRGRCNKVSGDELRALAEEMVYNALPYPRETIDLNILNLPDEVLLPPGDLELQPTTQPNEDFIGYSFLAVNALIDGRLKRQITLHMKIGVTAEVAVAAVDIPLGAALAPGDVLYEVRDLATVDTQALTSADDFTGLTAKTGFRAGQVLVRRLLECPPAMRRGDAVTLEVVAGCVCVSTPCVAKQDGAVGDTIVVHCQTTGRDIQAHVVDPQTVRLIARPARPTQPARSESR
jgi:flagellar basal body P-ring formation protein FlgA